MEDKKPDLLKKFEKSDFGKRIAKLSATASPAIAATIMFPAETYSFLKTAKEVGFEVPMMLFIGVVVWFFRKDTVRVVDTRVAGLTNSLLETAKSNTEVSVAVQSLSLEVKHSTAEAKEMSRISNERYAEVNERFLKNDQKFEVIGNKLVSVETLLQGIVPSIKPNEIKELAEKVMIESPGSISVSEAMPNRPDLTP